MERQREADEAAGQGQQQALRQPLAQQPAATGPERHAHGHLVPARGVAGEQQVGEVRAGDQQHDRSDALEQQQRPGEGATQPSESVPPGAQPEGLSEKLSPGVVAAGQLGQLCLSQVAVERTCGRLGFRPGDVRPQPRHQRHPLVAPVLQPVCGKRPEDRRHHHRDPHVDGVAELRAVEAGRRNADDRHRPPVQHDRSSHDRRLGAEPPLPVVVAQDHDRVSARRPVVRGRQQPAEPGPHAQGLEVVPRHQLAHGLLARPGMAEVDLGARETRDGGERRAAVPQVRVHWIGERIVRLGVCALRFDHHQPVRIANRKRGHQHGVHEREDCRVGANPQAEGQHRHRGEARVSREHPQAEADVLEESLHEGQAALVAVRFLHLLAAAEVAARREAGLLERQPAADVLLGQQLQVALQLLVELGIEGRLAEQAAQAGGEGAERGHVTLPRRRAAGGPSAPTSAPTGPSRSRAAGARRA